MIGLLYFVVIVLANSLGAVSGMGGGVLIKPIFDFIGADSVASVSFYSTVAVFTMSLVSTYRQIKSGVVLDWRIDGSVASGAIIGGLTGNRTFEWCLQFFEETEQVKLLQIGLTVGTLLFAYLYSKNNWKSFALSGLQWYVVSGLVLGFLASLLGIGGGPINVSLLMLLFNMPIKEATIYSITTIFFSQLSKLAMIATTTGFDRYDLTMLYFIIPAAIIGGFAGARLSRLLSAERVNGVFQTIILLVLFMNLYNAWKLF